MRQREPAPTNRWWRTYAACSLSRGRRNSFDRARRGHARPGSEESDLGSALFRDGQADIEFARSLSDRIGAGRLIAAVDGKAGKVVIHGWRTSLDLTPEQAVRQLEPFFGEFLYTHVDLEGLMRGTDMGAIRSLRAVTARALTAAGGITTHKEIEELDAMNVDAVVGMAVYTGKLKI